jgi:nicotinamide phosphoribosyltransferase
LANILSSRKTLVMPPDDPFDNILLLSDSYKVSHWVQYPPKTEFVYSYFESRGGQFPHVLFFGLQYIVKRYLQGVVVTAEKISQAEAYFKLHFGSAKNFNKAGWEYILNVHDGQLPISIKAVAEGTIVPTHNVLLTCVNTDPNCYWLTNFIETILVQVWYPSTVATNSYAQKKLIQEWMMKTGCFDQESLDFKLHDFGFRGVSSVESSAIGGLAHLVNFRGTDTLSALICGSEFYSEPCAGYSIPASEHSTITSWGKDHEVDAFRNMLNQYPDGLVACVSDSWDVFNAAENFWASGLRDLIMARDGRLVIRPDSGDPPSVVVKVLELLAGDPQKGFGPFLTTTSTGHKLLPRQIRVIQGDAIDYDMIEKIYSAMHSAGWAADNVGFGSGGALLQKMNRDTLKFAFKCSSVTIDGREVDVYKDPVTDPGKRSKKGRLALGHEQGEWQTVKHDPGVCDQLVEIFRNGELLVEYSLSDIRNRASL